MLEDKPELANFTFFGNSYNVVHHAASKCPSHAGAVLGPAGSVCHESGSPGCGAGRTRAACPASCGSRRPSRQRAAGKGHLGVIQSVVEVLRSTAKDKTGVDTGDFKDQTLVTLTWSRYLRDLLNAQTTSGETALMLACQNGCAPAALPGLPSPMPGPARWRLLLPLLERPGGEPALITSFQGSVAAQARGLRHVPHGAGRGHLCHRQAPAQVGPPAKPASTGPPGCPRTQRLRALQHKPWLHVTRAPKH